MVEISLQSPLEKREATPASPTCARDVRSRASRARRSCLASAPSDHWRRYTPARIRRLTLPPPFPFLGDSRKTQTELGGGGHPAASEATSPFRGHFCVHCRYGPVTRRLPRETVDRLQSLGFPPPCYPNYGASFLPRQAFLRPHRRPQLSRRPRRQGRMGPRGRAPEAHPHARLRRPDLRFPHHGRTRQRPFERRVRRQILRVRGALKVKCHLMFGIVALAVDQIIRVVNYRTAPA